MTVYYHLTEYLDEIPPHKATLEDAAHFLQTGCFDRETTTPDDYWADGLPMAKPGDILEISTLTVLFDTTARRAKLDDGAIVWRLDDPLPPDCDFIAVRWRAGAGWSPVSICDPLLVDLSTHLEEVAEEMLFPGDLEEGVLEDVVAARHGECRARFDLIDGTPTLTIVEAKPS